MGSLCSLALAALTLVSGDAGPATKAKPIRLAFTGDVALNWRNTPPYWKRFPWRANPLRIFAPVFKSADLAVSNMEGVLMRRDPQYAEKRLNLWAPWISGQVFKPAGIGLVSTANNHAFDGRDVGVLATLSHLQRTGVTVMGTGTTEDAARQPFLFRRGASCIAIVPATTKVNKGVRGKATVAWYPKARRGELEELVRQTKNTCSFVVVYIHWGTEKAHFPGPKIKALAHRLVDAGAALIVGHHPHVLQGVEHYHGAPIAYSLGNMVFSNPTLPTRRTGVLWVELSPSAKPVLQRIELIPARIHRKGYTPHPATRAQAEDLLGRMQDYCRPLGTQVVLHSGRIRFLSPRDILPP